MIRRLGLTIDPNTLTRIVDDEEDRDDDLEIDIEIAKPVSGMLIASASANGVFVNSKFLKAQAALEIDDQDYELFDRSVDAVSGEGAAVQN